MNQDDFHAFCTAEIDECYSLLGMKGQEYSSDVDRLANFKNAAAALGLDPLDVWAVYYRKHVDAQMSFVKRMREARETAKPGTPFAVLVSTLNLSEPIFGRFRDVINYNLLGAALIAERARPGAALSVHHDLTAVGAE